MNKFLLLVIYILFQNSIIYSQENEEKTLSKDLFEAIRQNNVNNVKNLLKSGVNVNSTEQSSFTPLMQAIFTNKVEIAKLLLEHPEIKVNLGSNKLTPLMLAIMRGNKDIIKLLLKKPEININAKDSQGLPALRYAANQKEIYDLLLKDPRIKVSYAEYIIDKLLLASNGSLFALLLYIFILILIIIFIIGIFINVIQLKRWFGIKLSKSLLINLKISFISTLLFSLNFFVAAMYANDLSGSMLTISMHLSTILTITCFMISFILSYNLMNYHFILTNQKQILSFLAIRIIIISITTTILWISAAKILGFLTFNN